MPVVLHALGGTMEATDLARVDLVFPLRGEVIPLDHGSRYIHYLCEAQ